MTRPRPRREVCTPPSQVLRMMEMGSYESRWTLLAPMALVDHREVEVLTHCPPVLIDEIIYNYVLTNVIDNAQKYGTESTIRCVG